MTEKQYYGYHIKEVELGYEVRKLKDDTTYFVSYTEERGLQCTCVGTWKGGAMMCKHRRWVRDLFMIPNIKKK